MTISRKIEITMTEEDLRAAIITYLSSEYKEFRESFKSMQVCIIKTNTAVPDSTENTIIVFIPDDCRGEK